MFIGRKDELELLNNLYNSSGFEFLILYGRRRIGKTFLLEEFAKSHKCIFFSAMEKNDSMNLSDFSELIQRYFEGDFIAPFQDWKKAFDYIGNKSDKEKVCLIIDEFPYIAQENPTVKSILQHQIDKSWINKNIKLILCGSNISYMEADVMGQRSPLYGRSTAQWEVKKFSYKEAAEFFPTYSYTDKLIAYGILGGIPRYLSEFNNNKSLKENIKTKILTAGAFLKEEPLALLRMEVREPNIYNSILQAVASGTNRTSEIASAIHEEQTKVGKYISILISLRFLTKVASCTENPESKKGIYKISDNFFNFWYRYEFSNRNYYNLIGTDRAVDEIMDNINDYMGPVFESICQQYLTYEAGAGKLPFIPYYFGRWWGNNPAIKAQDDVDILALNKAKDKGIFCECKFKNSKFDTKDFEDIIDSLKIFPSLQETWIYVFSKSGWTEGVQDISKDYNVKLITIEDLF